MNITKTFNQNKNLNSYSIVIQETIDTDLIDEFAIGELLNKVIFKLAHLKNSDIVLIDADSGEIKKLYKNN